MLYQSLECSTDKTHGESLTVASSAASQDCENKSELISMVMVSTSCTLDSETREAKRLSQKRSRDEDSLTEQTTISDISPPKRRKYTVSSAVEQIDGRQASCPGDDSLAAKRKRETPDDDVEAPSSKKPRVAEDGTADNILKEEEPIASRECTFTPSATSASDGEGVQVVSVPRSDTGTVCDISKRDIHATKRPQAHASRTAKQTRVLHRDPRLLYLFVTSPEGNIRLLAITKNPTHEDERQEGVQTEARS